MIVVISFMVSVICFLLFYFGLGERLDPIDRQFYVTVSIVGPLVIHANVVLTVFRQKLKPISVKNLFDVLLLNVFAPVAAVMLFTVVIYFPLFFLPPKLLWLAAFFGVILVMVALTCWNALVINVFCEGNSRTENSSTGKQG